MGHAEYRQAHPLPYVIVHWTHLLSMLALIVTGFYIHDPFFQARMGTMRQVHFVAMYVVLIALLARVWYLFAGRSALLKGSRETAIDVRNFLPQPENHGQMLETVRYYLFLRKTHPASAKYNPLQKLAYVAMGLLLLLQACTGFAIYGPVQNSPLLGPVFAAGTAAVGGLMAMRTIHYLVTWVFVALILVHLYLSLAEDIRSVPLMFLWIETPAEGDPGEADEVETPGAA